jgi:suppressor of G2 allele of SKP1
MTRYEWYQTVTHVIITIFVKNIKKEDVKLESQPAHLLVTIRLPSSEDFYSLDLDLADFVVVDESKVVVSSYKVEIQLKKQFEGRTWPKLERISETTAIQGISTHTTQVGTATISTRPIYPSSSKHAKDWDAIERQAAREDQETKPEGDAAVNDFFQKLYANASDDVRRAMNKSFTESQGTCLSTNWEEVARSTVKPYEGSIKESQSDR